MDTEKEQFIAFVVRLITAGMPNDASEHDRETVRWSAERAWDGGCDRDDAVAYCRTFEEVDPTLDESIALERRTALARKYMGRARLAPIWPNQPQLP